MTRSQGMREAKGDSAGPNTRWDLAVLAQLLPFLSPYLPLPHHSALGECERWPGCNSDSAMGLLLPHLARSREIQSYWLASSLVVRFSPRNSLKMAMVQRRSSVPDPCTYLWVCGGEPSGLLGGNQSPKGLLCLCISSKGLQTQTMQVLRVVFSNFPSASSVFHPGIYSAK